MIKHTEIEAKMLRLQIRKERIGCAGNKKLYIYGSLHCKSGKRMAKRHRVFFTSAEEVIASGYRPCGHCTRSDYLIWRNGFIQHRINR